jgi:hypothetical protein
MQWTNQVFCKNSSCFKLLKKSSAPFRFFWQIRQIFGPRLFRPQTISFGPFCVLRPKFQPLGNTVQNRVWRFCGCPPWVSNHRPSDGGFQSAWLPPYTWHRYIAYKEILRRLWALGTECNREHPDSLLCKGLYEHMPEGLAGGVIRTSRNKRKS